MADLRDQLLRAGLVDKKTKQQADTTARRNRKKKKKKKKKKARTDDQADKQRQAYEERIATEAAQNRRRDLARNEERAALELRNSVANLTSTWAVRELKPGPRRFCFVSRNRKIQWFDLSPTLARKIEQGQLAIVEHPGVADEPHALVPARIAARIEKLDPEAVRFWNRTPADPPAAEEGE